MKRREILKVALVGPLAVAIPVIPAAMAAETGWHVVEKLNVVVETTEIGVTTHVHHSMCVHKLYAQHPDYPDIIIALEPFGNQMPDASVLDEIVKTYHLDIPDIKWT